VFDIGFLELLIIAIVGLVVIGPERLPETVRAVSLWVGRLKRSLRETLTEIERQVGADDIRRQLHNENVMRSLEKTRQSIDEAIQASSREISGSLSNSSLQDNPDEDDQPGPSTTDKPGNSP
jgi:sec-independent protein translocase protein TatB